jgi:hypothetical protein
MVALLWESFKLFEVMEVPNESINQKCGRLLRRGNTQDDTLTPRRKEAK